jgi:membrane carboxypeptidase/penicillin-binding protein
MRAAKMAPRWIKTALAIVGGLFLSVVVLLSMVIGVIFIPPELEARSIVLEAQAEGRVDSRTWQEALPPRVGQAIVAAEFPNSRRCPGTPSPQAVTLARVLVRNPEQEHLHRHLLTERAVGRILDEQYEDDMLIDDLARQIYFGRKSHGVDQAAQAWFAKSPAELNAPEAAFLALLLKGPGNFDPAHGTHAAERAMSRRYDVLRRMRDMNFIDDAELERARVAPLGVIDPPSAPARQSGVGPRT